MPDAATWCRASRTSAIPWLDAGIVPFSTLHYRHDRHYWQKWFPADFITESFPGQFRNWFYSLLVMSTVWRISRRSRPCSATGSCAVKTAGRCTRAPGNAIDFNEAAESAGADVMRWIFCLQNPAANVNFGWKAADETRRRLRKLWDTTGSSSCMRWPNTGSRCRTQRGRGRCSANTARPLAPFATQHAGRDAARASRRLRRHVGRAAIEDFFDDLSNWYIRLEPGALRAPGGHADPAALATLHEALVTLTLLLAPFLPFLAEELYQNLVRGADPSAPTSVHHCPYPAVDDAVRDPELERLMDLTRLVAGLGNAARKGASIRSRQPLPALRVARGSTFRSCRIGPAR